MNSDLEINNSELEKAAAEVLNYSKETELLDIDEFTTENNRKLLKWALDSAERDETGRLTLPLLWKSNKHLLGKDFELSSFNKFNNNPEYLKLMDDTFNIQQSQGIIEKITDINKFCSENPHHSFIPHMGIFNPDKDTSKCLVVFLSNLSEKDKENPNALSQNQ